MLKSVLFSISALFLALFSFGQSYHYHQAASSYIAIHSGISLTTTSPWDDPSAEINLPFSFDLYGSPIQQLSLGEGFGAQLFTQNQSGTSDCIALIDADLIDLGYGTKKSKSLIHYTVDGAIGARILKIEWSNVGFRSKELPKASNLKDFANYQLWLFEGTNILEVHFGPSSVQHPERSFYNKQGPFGYLIHQFDEQNQTISPLSIQLTKNAENLQLINTTSQLQTIGSWPKEGTVIQIRPKSGSAFSDDFTLFPNPTSNIAMIKDLRKETTLLYLTDSFGKKLDVPVALGQIDLSDQPNGLYFVHYQSQDGQLKTKTIARINH